MKELPFKKPDTPQKTTQILSQDEVKVLLEAISGKGDDTGRTENNNIQQDGNVALYDFRRPERFSREYLRYILRIHKNFAVRLEHLLSSETGKGIDIKTDTFDQILYEEWVWLMPLDASFGIISMDPLPGPAIVSIDSRITNFIIEGMFGGSGHGAETGWDLTEIDTSVMRGLFAAVAEELWEAWADVADVNPALISFKTCSQNVKSLNPDDMILYVNMKAKVQNIDGTISVCMPFETWEEVQSLTKMPGDALSAQSNAIAELKDYEKNTLLRESDVFAVDGLDITTDNISQLKKGKKYDNVLLEFYAKHYRQEGR